MDQLLRQFNEKLKKALEHFQARLKSLRTGRAEAGLVEEVKVEAYGSLLSLRELGSITVPEPRQLLITPWDKNLVGAVEKAIRRADLGVEPVSEVNFVRVRLPILTTERREELVKLLHREAEEAKVGVRNLRQELLKEVEKMKREKAISEDDEERGKKSVQTEVERINQSIEELVAGKEREIRKI